MIEFQELSNRLADCAAERISLGQFEDWFVLNSWNIHQANDQELVDAVFRIEALLSGHLDNRIDSATLLRAFGNLAREYRRDGKAVLLYSHFVLGEEHYAVAKSPVQLRKPQDITLWFGATQKPLTVPTGPIPISRSVVWESHPIHV